MYSAAAFNHLWVFASLQIGLCVHCTCTWEKGPCRANNDYFCIGVFSATTPKNNSRDKTLVFVSELSPTLCLLSLREWKYCICSIRSRGY